jgi:hypothetical protein
MVMYVGSNKDILRLLPIELLKHFNLTLSENHFDKLTIVELHMHQPI